MKKHLFLAAIALCFGALNVASAYAQTNTIYACYQKENGQLRKVSGPGQCKKSETEISWSMAGIPGPKGDAGQSVTSEVIPPGDARCPNGVGGVQYTDSTGVRVVCNGQQGEKGDKGEPGIIGPGSVGASHLAQLPNARAIQFNQQTFAPGPLGTASRVALDFAPSSFDVIFDNANDRFIIQTPGVYLITGEINWLLNGSGDRLLTIYVNNLQVNADSRSGAPHVDIAQNVTTMIRLSPGDSVYMLAGHSSNGNLSTHFIDTRAASLAVTWLTP